MAARKRKSNGSGWYPAPCGIHEYRGRRVRTCKVCARVISELTDTPAQTNKWAPETGSPKRGMTRAEKNEQVRQMRQAGLWTR